MRVAVGGETYMILDFVGKAVPSPSRGSMWRHFCFTAYLPILYGTWLISLVHVWCPATATLNFSFTRMLVEFSILTWPLKCCFFEELVWLIKKPPNAVAVSGFSGDKELMCSDEGLNANSPWVN